LPLKLKPKLKESAGTGVTKTDPSVTFFFVSYFIIGNIVFLNVVIAVLLDEFISTVQREKEAAAVELEKENAKRRLTGVLDPITTQLQAFDSRENLSDGIAELYSRLDLDGSGGLTYEEFKDGIKSLPGISKIHMTVDDFDQITEGGQHLTDGEFDDGQFQHMMKSEFWRFSQRQLANSIAESESKEFKATTLQLKMLEMRLLDHIDKASAAGGHGPPHEAMRFDEQGCGVASLKGDLFGAKSELHVDRQAVEEVVRAAVGESERRVCERFDKRMAGLESAILEKIEALRELAGTQEQTK